ncbi:MAG: hypothetical protein A3E87_03205 [Gammaproteobacteria bacterium RIFCSPHIGHO2_12_FULL_35_23]|nr:MAG: hypothetical protein A3E87_03205 [Gammaproteobacteria bacterium RIFCSPHIGHO2_12_FULL_35_23]
MQWVILPKLVLRKPCEKKNGRIISYDYFSLQKNTNKPKMLTRNGFIVLGQYGLDGSKFSEKTTKEILTVAKKL